MKTLRYQILVATAPLSAYPSATRADAFTDALDMPGLVWTDSKDGGGGPWTVDYATTHDGVDAVQHFHAAFGVGADDKHIATVDAGGVALPAIRGLNAKVEVGMQNAEVSIRKLEAENAELKARLEKPEQLRCPKNGGAK